MKKTFIAVLSAVFAFPVASVLAVADSSPTTQGSSDAGKEKRTEALERLRSALEQLDLTAAQKEKIKSILSDAHSKVEALKGSSDAEGQVREIRQKARQDVMAVLTPEQKAKLREILQKDRSQDKA